MSRIAERFSSLAGRKAFVPYLTAGDPSLDVTRQLAHMLEAEGADVLELGVPFTDPIADGPVNQRASQRALDRGVTPGDVLDLVTTLRDEGFALPIVLFTYSNPLLRILADGGYARLSGVDGMLVTDLPPEEADEHIAAARAHGLDTVFLAAPTTPPERMAAIGQASSGFLYYVSSKGVTGARSALPDDLEGQVAAIKANTDLPVCVGFGISTRESAARVCEVADGFVIGSALVRTVEEAVEADRDPVEALRAFVRSVDPR
jgi:tryptophan synthase alpha chain